MIDDYNYTIEEAVNMIKDTANQYLDLYYSRELTYQQLIDYFDFTGYICTTFDNLVIIILSDAVDQNTTFGILYDALQIMDVLYSFVTPALAYYGFVGNNGDCLKFCMDMIESLIS